MKDYPIKLRGHGRIAAIFLGGAEVDVSMYSYIPIAFVNFGVIGLCTQDAMPKLKEERAI